MPRAVIIASFLAAIATGAVDQALRMWGKEPPGRAYSRGWPSFTTAQVLAGELLEPLEQAFLATSYVVHGPGALYNEAAYAAFGRVSHRASVVDNWIFLRERRMALPMGQVDQVLNAVPQKILEVCRALRAAGVEPVVMIVPNRWRFFRERHARPDEPKVPRSHDRIKDALVRSLQGQGFSTVDLLRPMVEAHTDERPVFYRSDHHWTGRGAEVSARHLADVLVRQGLARPGTGEPYDVAWGPDANRSGSLLNFLRFRRGSAAERPFQDDQPFPVFSKAAALSDPRIAVFATSYGLWGFSEFLARFLGQPVAGHVAAGKGPNHAPSGFLRSTGRSPGIKVVIWEIPEYHLFRTDLAAFAVPDVAKPALSPLRFSVEGQRGLKQESPALEFTSTTQSSRLRLGLERPVRCARVVLDVSPLEGRGYVQFAGDASGQQLLADGLGLAFYEARFDVPSDQLVLEIGTRRPGARFRVVELGERVDGACAQ